MAAKMETKILLVTLLLYVATNTYAQENTTESETISTSASTRIVEEATETHTKESLILQDSKPHGYFKPSYGPPKRVPKSEGSYYDLKPNPYQPIIIYHSTYHIKPTSYHHLPPHYHPHEAKYQGYDHGYKKYPGHIPRYKKPWGSFPHYDIPNRGYHHRPIHYPHYDGYSGGFGGIPEIYPSPLDVHTIHNYEIIKVHHGDEYEERNDEMNPATGSPQNSTEKAMGDVKDTIILIPENKETKRQVEATTPTTTTTPAPTTEAATTEESKNGTEAAKPT